MRPWLAAVGCAGMVACAVYTEDLLVAGGGGATTTSQIGGHGGAGAEGASGGTTSSTTGGDGGGTTTGGGGTTTSGGGGTGGGGGQGPECTQADQCPEPPSDCVKRTCVDGKCGTEDVTKGTNCSSGGGKVCDGMGVCRECLTALQCQPNEQCVDNKCTTGADGTPCTLGAQCTSGKCVDGVCCAADCAGTCEACNLSGLEGTCSPVPDGGDPDQECAPDACNGMGQCRCGDMGKNGNETDVDCGGGACGACPDGKTCLQGSDCQSGFCQGTCKPPSCTDLVKNGNETDVDCGGGCPNACGDGKGCAQASDCQSGVCNVTCQAPVCGDNVKNGSEQCDDGNTEPFDGCSATCRLPADHLLISEIVAAPTDAELIEIYNPTAQTVSLADYYLADFSSYYLVTKGTASPGSTDFLIRFPAAATIGPGKFVVVSLESAGAFQVAYNKAPDFDLDALDMGAPAMLGDYTASSGLTNDNEMVVLFRWNGSDDLVTDVDYLTYGNTTSGADKSGVTVGSKTYQADTPLANQVAASAPASGKSKHRCDTAEVTETKVGGNGTSGHDETSESASAAFKTLATPTPGGPPPMAFCP